jgi:hypothetical protein
METERRAGARPLWRCPVCATWDERPPVHCTGCEWRDPVGAQQARDRLAKVNRSGAPLAYHRWGCRVCRQCRRQFQGNTRRCPLHFFYFGLRAWALTRHIESPELARSAVRTLLDELLAERGYPEEVEGYWRRALAWLEGIRGRQRGRG